MSNIVKIKLNSWHNSIRTWVRSSPDDAMIAIGLCVIVMTVAVIFAFIGIFKSNSYSGELPMPTEQVATKDGWVLQGRNAVGGDVCDLYQKGMSYKVKCYAKNENGKWYLKNVF